MTRPPRIPHPRLVRAVTPYLDGAQPEHVFVAQVGGNPAWAIGALPLGIASLLMPVGTTVGVVFAMGLSVLFVAWVVAVYVPMKSRVVAVTEAEIVVLDASKVRFEPKGVVRRLDPSHRFGRVKGFLTGKVDLGDGEQAWVYKGYAGTIAAIDGGYEEQPIPGVVPELPPRQRLFRRRPPEENS
ncbi:MAG: hypothetical protein ACRD29_10970 [Acidimicrobiales bacterium]